MSTSNTGTFANAKDRTPSSHLINASSISKEQLQSYVQTAQYIKKYRNASREISGRNAVEDGKFSGATTQGATTQ